MAGVGGAGAGGGGGGCKTLLSRDAVAAALGGHPKEMQVFELLEAEQAIPSQLRTFCPHKDCSMPLQRPDDTDAPGPGPGEDGFTACPACHRAFCLRCLIPGWHHGYTCAEFQALPPHLRSAEDAALLRYSARRQWRQCPRCRQMVERSEGCNHVRCRCGAGFCYACGAEYRDGRPTRRNEHGTPGCRCPLFDVPSDEDGAGGGSSSSSSSNSSSSNSSSSSSSSDDEESEQGGDQEGGSSGDGGGADDDDDRRYGYGYGYGYGARSDSIGSDGGDGPYSSSDGYGYESGYGRAGSSSYDRDTDGYRSVGYSSDGYGSDGYGSDGYGRDGYGRDRYGSCDDTSSRDSSSRDSSGSTGGGCNRSDGRRDPRHRGPDRNGGYLLQGNGWEQAANPNGRWSGAGIRIGSESSNRTAAGSNNGSGAVVWRRVGVTRSRHATGSGSGSGNETGSGNEIGGGNETGSGGKGRNETGSGNEIGGGNETGSGGKGRNETGSGNEIG
ncbi:hypothetical protein GPECTOR_10g1075 [Gonium pectorale]|uniref:RBR-type E3 ubiquitin transferase n=1 Tax=Gonium pectorale TaxID=33097 RepID=A0A150GQN3_GONPE|nr:hypothetical protein GPECTOR_10g1075 [Gonium pectorale]|eukprot:KXZ52052.1 hypothetical protein GPECTOR_10g1075 [Gonium pectorale]